MDVVSISVAKNQVKDIIEQGSTTTGDLIGQDPNDETGGLITAGTIAGLDETLKLNNHAAPAKVVGDKFAELESDIATQKQLMPTETPTVGKTLKVLSVNDDGTFVCGWADGASGGSTDVQINGTSITQDGVANIPIANNSEFGVVKTSSNLGIEMSSGGLIRTKRASDAEIDARTNVNNPIVPYNLNYAVKSALSDSKRIGTNGDGMTSVQMDNACSVLGAERSKGEWVLKGVLATENKSTGCTVDLTGCSQLLIYGNAVATGNASIMLNGSLAAYNVVTSSGKYFYSYFHDSIFGYCFTYGKSSGSSQTYIETAGRGYSKMDGTHLSDITIISWNNTSIVTECDVNIYAR